MRSLNPSSSHWLMILYIAYSRTDSSLDYIGLLVIARLALNKRTRWGLLMTKLADAVDTVYKIHHPRVNLNMSSHFHCPPVVEPNDDHENHLLLYKYAMADEYGLSRIRWLVPSPKINRTLLLDISHIYLNTYF